jgi:hypothetical protein
VVVTVAPLSAWLVVFPCTFIPEYRWPGTSSQVTFALVLAVGDRLRDDTSDLFSSVETGVSLFLVNANATPVAVSAYA